VAVLRPIETFASFGALEIVCVACCWQGEFMARGIGVENVNLIVHLENQQYFK
jgi:hypothetical protein